MNLSIGHKAFHDLLYAWKHHGTVAVLHGLRKLQHEPDQNENAPCRILRFHSEWERLFVPIRILDRDDRSRVFRAGGHFLGEQQIWRQTDSKVKNSREKEYEYLRQQLCLFATRAEEQFLLLLLVCPKELDDSAHVKMVHSD